jgi:hypothetical protein
LEVLLCMMAGRTTALLEPEMKQLRSLTMDKVMQVFQALWAVHAQVMLCKGMGQGLRMTAGGCLSRN